MPRVEQNRNTTAAIRQAQLMRLWTQGYIRNPDRVCRSAILRLASRRANGRRDIMAINITALRQRITRRAALGGAAALAAAPALAEDCRIGPPPHTKGPLVWNDLDQVELDAAYD